MKSFLVGLALCWATLAHGAEELLPEPQLDDNGLHHQDWFLESFLDIGEDLAEAQAKGKGLVIVFEQRGCPYCREMHR
ncbi:MAG: hypothetical protein H6891_00135 [Brucellaceae bacterium]|nr:hypothetical protein [Brucellaceae bacterium]